MPVIVLDTSASGDMALATREGSSGSNPYEATLVAAVAKLWLSGGGAGRALGMITPFKRQVGVVAEKLRSVGGEDVEVLTVDRA